ncbi:MAG TPA: helix-turn-helix domain-containing protein, partial [Terriglobia bacterium]|nr:helix-turn-helix domain-containing protein [Terriglobia bacterium]
GNVRELENCIQHGLAMAAGPEIEVVDLPANVVYSDSASEWSGEADQAGRSVTSLDQLERQAILHALKAANGDRQRAAKLLGIGKTTIYRKLKEYELAEGSEDMQA